MQQPAEISLLKLKYFSSLLVFACPDAHWGDQQLLEQKLDYIHDNPVQERWLLSESAFEYEYSSCRFYEDDKVQDFPLLIHYMEVFS